MVERDNDQEGAPDFFSAMPRSLSDCSDTRPSKRVSRPSQDRRPSLASNGLRQRSSSQVSGFERKLSVLDDASSEGKTTN